MSHLESLKIEVGRRNEEVRTLKRTNSAARVVRERYRHCTLATVPPLASRDP